MNSDPFAAPQDLRQKVIFFFLFLSSEDCQKAFAPVVPGEKLAFELCRLWFDDIYTPGRWYMNSIKGDYSEEAARHFQSCFTEDELQALERFHRFLELRIDMIPDVYKEQCIIPESDLWRNIVRHAGHVVEALAPGAKKLHHRLQQKIQEAIKTSAHSSAARGWQQQLFG